MIRNNITLKFPFTLNKNDLKPQKCLRFVLDYKFQKFVSIQTIPHINWDLSYVLPLFQLTWHRPDFDSQIFKFQL